MSQCPRNIPSGANSQMEGLGCPRCVYHSLQTLNPRSGDAKGFRAVQDVPGIASIPGFDFTFANVSQMLVQTLFDALEELCDEDEPGGENPTLPPHLAPAVVHTFDRVGEQGGNCNECDEDDEHTLQSEELVHLIVPICARAHSGNVPLDVFVFDNW